MATLSRRVHAQSETQYLAWVTLWDEAAGNNRQKAKGFATKAMTGRLRLVRTGSTLSYSAADGPAGEFVLLQQYPFGAEDLKDVRLVGATDDAQGSLDVRVTDFHIRAASLPHLPAAPPAQAPPRGWWVPVLLGLAVAVPAAAAAGAWLALRRRAMKVPARPAVPDRPAKLEATAPPVTSRCPGCGKNFKARAQLAGKKVKCPQCGTAVLVSPNPSSKAGPVPPPG
jgi:hypothetical protein